MSQARRRFLGYVAGAFVAGSFRCLAPAPAALAPSAIGGLRFYSFTETLKSHYDDVLADVEYESSPLLALIAMRGHR